MPTKVGAIAGRVYHTTMFFLLVTIGLGTAFIVLTMSSRFFKWKVEECRATGNVYFEEDDVSRIVNFFLNMEVDIGWREFTISSIDKSADRFCIKEFSNGGVYPIEDFQNNGGGLAGLGMVASWALGVLVAIYTFIALIGARHGQRRGGVSLTALTKWCALFSIGVVVATTVFWWLVEGKFGRREESLAPRLFDIVVEAAEDNCSIGTNEEFCNEASWSMITPGWALSLGITAMFAYGAAVFLLSLIANRVDHLNSGEEELEMDEPAKPAAPAGANVAQVVEKQTPQSEERTRGKDRRSAKTGVRAVGGRAPSATVQGEQVDSGPDPMTYALEQGHDEEEGSVDDDDEDEVVYQNHQVHHAVINHSNPNPTQQLDDQSRQYSRSYSRGTSGASYITGGDRSFDDGQSSDFSETASSAQYYAQGRGTGGRSFMSSSSRGESFDEYR